jgi:putative ABC transport system ATP-binding protein
VLGFLRRSVREFGQTVVMVTHDPAAAGYADRVLFLADGQIVDEMTEPTADRVLDRMKGFDPQHQGRPVDAGSIKDAGSFKDAGSIRDTVS